MTKRTCAVPDCTTKMLPDQGLRKGLCPKHYQRLRKPSLSPKKAEERKCACCGKSFETTSALRKYCSGTCSNTARRPGLTCWVCGNPMQKARTSKPQGKAAHRACRAAVRESICLYCASPFASKLGTSGATKCCSKSCARKLEIREGLHPLIKPNTPPGRDPARRRASSGRSWRKRRALKLAVPSEPYTVDFLAERDEFICHLCGDLVDMTLFWPDRYSPSVDHVIPLSRGGDDTLANVKLSHLTCNLSKGNRVEEVCDGGKEAEDCVR